MFRNPEQATKILNEMSTYLKNLDESSYSKSEMHKSFLEKGDGFGKGYYFTMLANKEAELVDKYLFLKRKYETAEDEEERKEAKSLLANYKLQLANPMNKSILDIIS